MSKILQVRNLPNDVHRRLKSRAEAEGRSLSDLVRDELTELSRRPTMSEMLERLDRRGSVEVGESAAEAIRLERSEP
ncbi:MAG: FitA-like ribbon-helix-helix domain-containing protein [Solirubrobacterales bacterium]